MASTTGDTKPLRASKRYLRALLPHARDIIDHVLRPEQPAISRLIDELQGGRGGVVLADVVSQVEAWRTGLARAEEGGVGEEGDG
jgi:hypothetical protein